MKENRQELLILIQGVCEKAKEGTLKLDIFYDQWPKEANSNPLFKQIYEDIEDAIEHTPGFLFRKGIDLKSWYASDMYLTLYLDSILLKYDKSWEELMQCRETVLKQKSLSTETIEDEIKKCLG